MPMPILVCFVQVLIIKTVTYLLLHKFCHRFIKYSPVFKIPSPTHSAVNLQVSKPAHEYIGLTDIMHPATLHNVGVVTKLYFAIFTPFKVSMTLNVVQRSSKVIITYQAPNKATVCHTLTKHIKHGDITVLVEIRFHNKYK